MQRLTDYLERVPLVFNAAMGAIQRRKEVLITSVSLFVGACIYADPVEAPIIVEAQKFKTKDWRKYQTNLLTHLTEYQKKETKLSPYGGRLDRREVAKGFFYAKQLENDQWVIVDPEGYHTLSVGLNGIKPGTDREDTEKLFPKKFGTEKRWAEETKGLLFEELGLTMLGSWSDDRAFHDNGVRVPYNKYWGFMANYGKHKGVAQRGYGNSRYREGVIPVFDPEFREFAEQRVKRDIENYVNDPWFFGHFTDNELPLNRGNIIRNYLKLPPEDHGYLRAKAFLKEKGIEAGEITPEHDEEFCYIVIATYFETVHDVLRKHDPNHMILGTRFHGGVKYQDISYEAAGPFVDIVSINYYNSWSPSQKNLSKWAGLAGKPILITEFYAKGVDAGLVSKSGAGFLTKTQASRGQFYENFVIGLLQNKNVVGWHWHRYIDDGTMQWGERSSNKGFLDVEYNAWKPLTDSVQALNSQMYTLRDYLQSIDSKNLLLKSTEVK
ncbi:MAG: hypothetical protein ACPGN3_15395 [Opitutales bacterium]